MQRSRPRKLGNLPKFPLLRKWWSQDSSLNLQTRLNAHVCCLNSPWLRADPQTGESYHVTSDTLFCLGGPLRLLGIRHEGLEESRQEHKIHLAFPKPDPQGRCTSGLGEMSFSWVKTNSKWESRKGMKQTWKTNTHIRTARRRGRH